MSALARVVVVTLLVGLVFLFIGGIEAGTPVALMVPLGILALGAVLFRRPGALVDLGWAGRALAGQAPAASVTADAPTEAPPVAAPRPPATRRQVAAALARAEAREWLASPWFALGIAFCVLMTVLFGWVWANDSDGLEGPWRFWFVHFPIMAHPMVGMAVVTAHQTVTRGRRDRAEEIFEACPTDDATRTTAHLRCAWLPAVAIAVFVVVITLSMTTRNDRIYGPIDGRALADVLTAVALGASGAWLGVALGRWAPGGLVPVVFVAALLPILVGLGNLGEPHWSNLRQLSSWPRYPDHELLFTDPPVWWHLLWLTSLGALMAVLAIARTRRNRLVLATAVAVVAAVAGVAQTRPLSAQAAAHLASLVAEPERHQTCDAAAWVQVCVYRGYERYLDQVLRSVAPVAAATPGDLSAATFRQGFDGELDVLGPEVGRALGGRRVPVPGSDHLRLGYGTSDADMVAVRLRTAFAAVGLPVEPQPGDVPNVIAGQARGVVALWLAARGLGPADARRLANHHFNPDDRPESPTPTPLDLGMAWPDPCSAGPPPVAWAPQDLAAARGLLALPADQVHTLVLRDWGRFTDPAASTGALLAAAGIPAVGPPDPVSAVSTRCPY